MTEADTIIEAISGLSPTEFENLTYDCLQLIGLKNLVWRTPGADGGRDIEGIAYQTDLTGHESVQRWYVECKRYSSSIDWPTVWEKLSYADVQNADVFLLCTNSNPSPACESRLTDWNNSRRRPVTRVWRGYQLPKILRSYPLVALKYGILDDQSLQNLALSGITSVLTKTIHSAYLNDSLGQEPSLAIEASACLGELISKRLSDIKEFGKFLDPVIFISPGSFDWVSISGETNGWGDIELRAIFAWLRYQVRCSSINVEIDHEKIRGSFSSDWKKDTASSGMDDLSLISTWANISVRIDWEGGSFELE